jgi:hypothetical protein
MGLVVQVQKEGFDLRHHITWKPILWCRSPIQKRTCTAEKEDLHRGKGRPAPHKRKTCATEKKFLRN